MSGKDDAVKVKADIEKKKSALVSLQTLNGKTVSEMSKVEQEAYMTALGQLLGILNALGQVQI